MPKLSESNQWILAKEYTNRFACVLLAVPVGTTVNQQYVGFYMAFRWYSSRQSLLGLINRELYIPLPTHKSLMSHLGESLDALAQPWI